MDDEPEILEEGGEGGDGEAGQEPAPPIESRFLYVDVAAQRAKQLRRGALPRLEELAGDSEADDPAQMRRKFERIAMREVDRGKIRYAVPDSPRTGVRS